MPVRSACDPALQRMLDALVGAPAFVPHMDILGAIDSAAPSTAIFTAATTNSARFAFLDPRAKTFFIDWEKTAEQTPLRSS